MEPIEELVKSNSNKISEKCNRGKSWETRYEELLIFRKEYGHVNVSQGDPVWWSLGNWVAKQRQKRKVPSGKQGHLTEEQIALLEEIGFDWDRSSKKRIPAYFSQPEYVFNSPNISNTRETIPTTNSRESSPPTSYYRRCNGRIVFPLVMNDFEEPKPPVEKKIDSELVVDLEIIKARKEIINLEKELERLKLELQNSKKQYERKYNLLRKLQYYNTILTTFEQSVLATSLNSLSTQYIQ